MGIEKLIKVIDKAEKPELDRYTRSEEVISTLKLSKTSRAVLFSMQTKSGLFTPTMPNSTENLLSFLECGSASLSAPNRYVKRIHYIETVHTPGKEPFLNNELITLD